MQAEEMSCATLFHIEQPLFIDLLELQPVGAGLNVFEGRPKLSAWRDRVQAAIGKELFDDAHKALLSLQDNVKQIDASKMQPLKAVVVRLFL